jgi:hypothetical protein
MVRITEKITVDYRQNEKHGIFREIPYVYEKNGKKTYTELNVLNITRDKNKEPFEVDKGSAYVNIKIGDPDKTISGRHLYTITYTTKGVIRSFAEYDELYWNVTGNSWPTNIDKASAIVTIPNTGIQKAACYQGYFGSAEQCKATIVTDNVASYASTKLISEGEGMTIATGFSKGLVPILTVERPKTFWEKFTSWPSQLTLWAGILGAVGFITFSWYKNGRDLWFGRGILAHEKGEEKARPLLGGGEGIVVEFTPPDNLRPAELGVLMDERADTTDVVATIIDLAARGHLSITEIPKKWLFGSVDYEMTKEKKSTIGLLPYEKLLLDNLFESGDSIKMSKLRNTFYDELKEVKGKLYDHVVEKGLFPKNPETVWGTYFGIGIVLIIAGVFGFITTASNDHIFLADIAFAAIIAGILFAIFSFHMPRRTGKGRAMYQKAKGYRLFVSKAETHRQRFFEQKNLFNEVLPYAIMFGLTDKFFHAMKDMGVKTNPSWYHSSHPFSYGTFNSSMHSFSSGMSKAIASTPSNSGGFSGGSSGGGFGGGGGGSW